MFDLCSLFRRFLLVLAAGLCTGSAGMAAEPDLIDLEEAALRAAVERVAPSIVRIQTVGGSEQVGELLVGTGPTTGLIIDAEGYIVSSAFNFAQKPSSIVVELTSGERVPAKLLATDHSRMVVLLKVETEGPLPVPEAAEPDQVRVGSWAVAAGRTFDSELPNVSVGIVSAVGRMLGKAIQTDAKVSPNNYGGPLIDIHGRVLGVLVPMSPGGEGEVAGLELYDSGIGFVVPLAHVLKKLPELKQGRDVHAGILGVGLARGDVYTQPAKLELVHPRGPSYEAGLRSGDEIVQLDGRPIRAQMDLKRALGPRYAGETVSLQVKRADELHDYEVELTDALQPYEQAFLGVLPMHDAADDTPGVPVRYVYPDSPAAAAGIEQGDRLTHVNDLELNNRQAAMRLWGRFVPQQEVEVRWQRGEVEQHAQVKLADQPTAIPDRLPPAVGELKEFAGPRPEVGSLEERLPEFKSHARLYVPENFRPDVPYRLLVWLHGPGGDPDEKIGESWKQICRERRMILLAPQAEDPLRWRPTEIEFIAKLIAKVGKGYSIEPGQVVAHGYQSGGAMAYQLAVDNREAVAAVAVVDSPLPPLAKLPKNDPAARLFIYSAQSPQARFRRQIERSVAQLRQAKYPVIEHEINGEPRYLSDAEIAELGRWFDTLDRL